MFIILIFIIALLVLYILKAKRNINIKNKKISRKIKKFLKEYKIMIFFEIVFVIALIFINVFSKTILVIEKNPHSRKPLKTTLVKEGDYYNYTILSIDYDVNASKADDTNTNDNILQEGINFISKRVLEEKQLKIKKLGFNNITIENNDQEVNYKYGKGFTYYGPQSCSCGTPVVFNRPYTTYIIYLCSAVLIINLIIIAYIKDDNSKGENKNVRND